MRVYIGIPAVNLKNNYLKLKRRHSSLDIDWLHPDDLHITLIPPFNTKDITNEIKKLQDFSGKFQTTQVNLSEIESKSGFIWAFSPINEDLQKIKTALEKVFQSNSRSIYGKNESEFIPHVTLARFKNIKTPIETQKVNWKLKTDKIALYESLPYTTKSIGRYHIISQINLI